ncbi:MAG: winged helix DNA-binding domain-containing protein [Chitinophagaceae bacterium]
MTAADIRHYRLVNQQIAGSVFRKPEEIVNWLIAMQAQEFAMAKWAIGLRVPGSTDSIVEKAFNDGTILRTHLMRPTWHFVCPEDIRWLVKLTAPRVHALMAFMNRQLKLDSKIFTRSNDVIIKALEGGKFLTRIELQSALKKEKIIAEGPRLGHIMMNAELESIICSGPRQGKQFTYALLEERAPAVKALSREESLSAFATRYFTSRWPATVQDFAYWSGLTIKDAKTGAASLPGHFIKKIINGEEYILPGIIDVPKKKMKNTFLMPDYDEYGMSYKDRSAILPDDKYKKKASPVSYHMMVIDGVIGGTWQRTMKGNTVQVTTVPFYPSTKVQEKAITSAVKKHLAFFNKK